MAYPLILSDPNLRIRLERTVDEEPIEVIVKYHGDLQTIAATLNAQAEALSESIGVLTLPPDEVFRLYRTPEIDYVELPKLMHQMIYRALSTSCIPPVQRAEGYGLSGKGTIVAVIDSGIDYTHPAFRKENGETRILALWDQSRPGTPPPGFNIGTLYNKEEIDQSLESGTVLSEDVTGHGTAVTSVAAGNNPVGVSRVQGVAPESSLLIVKLRDTGAGTTRSTDIMRAVKFVLDTALAMQMPVAVNISYGTNDGAHDGNSLFEQYLTDASERWRCSICVAAGNEGSTGHHYSSIVEEQETQTVPFSIGGTIRKMYISMWKNFVDTISVELIAPNGDSTGIIPPTQSVTSTVLQGVQVTVLYGQPNHYQSAQEVFFALQASRDFLPVGLWELRLTGDDIVNGTVEIWLPLTDAVSRETSFLWPNPDRTVTIPGTARGVITVGGYNNYLGTIADFSGRGDPNCIMKETPLLVAPAVNIVVAQPGGGYDSDTGTSIATPFVTGSAALMMQWGIVEGNDPFLFGQRVAAFLTRGANRETPRLPLNIQEQMKERNGSLWPNYIWGYGTLKLCTSMDELVKYNRGGTGI